MKLPAYDVLIPSLMIGFILPGAAGIWWRHFSGYAVPAHSVIVESEQTPPPQPGDQAGEEIVSMCEIRERTSIENRPNEIRDPQEIEGRILTTSGSRPTAVSVQ